MALRIAPARTEVQAGQFDNGPVTGTWILSRAAVTAHRWTDENGDWLRKILNLGVCQHAISCGACPYFHCVFITPSAAVSGTEDAHPIVGQTQDD